MFFFAKDSDFHCANLVIHGVCGMGMFVCLQWYAGKCFAVLWLHGLGGYCVAVDVGG